MLKHLFTKFKESFFSVLPIIIIVLILNFSITPIPKYTFILFLVSAFILIIGITLFTLGVETSMLTMGEKISSSLIKSKRVALILFVVFLIGVFITIAEPDLKILAQQISSIPKNILIFSISIGMGIALVVCFLRVFLQVKFSYLIIGLYLVVFILAFLAKPEFISIAFEAGGVTTGPIFVPFIMAIGLGLVAVKSNNNLENNSFGLVAVCLIAPVISVLILSMFYTPLADVHIETPLIINNMSDIFNHYANSIPIYSLDVLIALIPIVVLFLIFQAVTLKLSSKTLIKIFIGLIYTYVGLVLFLTSVNLGFMSIGTILGKLIVEKSLSYLLIPLGFIFGFFLVSAEPSVVVLKHKVEDVTDGAISAKSMGIGLSIGVGISVAISMFRVLTGLPILWIIIPGYVVALILSFFVPSLFTSIAFDSGAVASGPLAATFLLPFAIGASSALGGNVFTDAFGIVSLVALTPVIVIQCMGLLVQVKAKKLSTDSVESLAENNIIEYDIESSIIFEENEEDIINK